MKVVSSEISKKYVLVLVPFLVVVLVATAFLWRNHITGGEKDDASLLAIQIVQEFSNTVTNKPLAELVDGHVETLATRDSNLTILGWQAKEMVSGVYEVVFSVVSRDEQADFTWHVWVREKRVSAVDDNARQFHV